VLTGYDVIGDVHGHADPLVRLLELLGYSEVGGVYRHPGRQAIFVGDLIDRGPKQLEVYRLVRAMVDAGEAQIVMGNHEFNAIAWATPDPLASGGFLREHSEKNTRQHAAFLAAVGNDVSLHAQIVEWFRTMPLWLDVDHGGGCLRVVHACWHERSMRTLGGDAVLTPEVLAAAMRRNSPEYEAVEVLLKGPEADLGDAWYLDKGGHRRHNARICWWDSSITSVRDAVLLPGDVLDRHGADFERLKHIPFDRRDLLYYDDLPVIFGHYWNTGEPTVLSRVAASVDFSVANEGHLVAYRWNGERSLSNDRFESVSRQSDDAPVE